MIIVKSPREIALMKRAGETVGLVFKTLEKEIRAGMSTLDIDTIVEKVMRDSDCIPAEKAIMAFPARLASQSTRLSFTEYLLARLFFVKGI